MYGQRALRRSRIRPEKLGIDLLRLYQVFQLFKSSECPVLENLFRHVNPLKQITELFCSAPRVPSAFEAGQMLANLLKGDAVAAIILTRSSKTHTTVRKHLAHDLRNLADAIIVRSIADVEYFVVNRFTAGARIQLVR
jgi:hypothetical protein